MELAGPWEEDAAPARGERGTTALEGPLVASPGGRRARGRYGTAPHTLAAAVATPPTYLPTLGHPGRPPTADLPTYIGLDTHQRYVPPG